ncbi:hypothetical protein RclHR1_16340001 [Rhizophagus clarus]|uniref:TLDc domain-containing protein n=1 Tax=Rhizophagus clarus TaxID=94130 RepID=A0A2Z6QIW5_9GLOM|nr:hypothetical protein RclHR1_16340001 [Rhizophagus clarus]
MEQYFELIYRTSFQSNSLLKLQQYCTNFIDNSPEKIFKSLDFTSPPENLLVSLIKRDDLQMREIEIWEHVLKWGLERNLALLSDPVTCEPKDNILLPRYRNIDEIVDTKIVNLNIVSLVSRWIDKIDINNKFAYARELYLPYEFRLLLRGSSDGFTPKKFHELCDDELCTVTFIKIKGTEEIIGEYNPLKWESSNVGVREGKFGETKDSFIFSFKSKNHFKAPILSHVNNIKEALFYHAECGPTFGNSDINIIVKENDDSKEYDRCFCPEEAEYIHIYPQYYFEVQSQAGSGFHFFNFLQVQNAKPVPDSISKVRNSETDRYFEGPEFRGGPVFRRSGSPLEADYCPEEADRDISKVQNSKRTKDRPHLAADQICVFPEVF